MRKRVVHVAVLVAAVLLLGAPSAHAWDIWDWLEGLSGPGPFRGNGTIAVSGGCIPIREADRTKYSESKLNLFGIPDNAGVQPWSPCFFFERNFDLTADAEPAPTGRFAEVKAHMWNVGVTFSVWRPIELGVGVGRVHFESKGIATDRTSIVLPRVVIKPLLFVPALQKHKDLGAFKYYLSTVSISNLAGENFGVSNTVFDERNKREWLTSRGVIVDLLELIGR